jgi:hypothetical protein
VITAFRRGMGKKKAKTAVDLENFPKGAIDIERISEPSGHGHRTRFGGLEDEVIFPDEIELFSKKIKKTMRRLPTQRKTMSLLDMLERRVV